MTEDTYPDIEIYVRRPELASITDWLDERFGIQSRKRSGSTLLCHLDRPAIECVIVENASDGFTSIWFKSSRTPWEDDRACAREAFERFGLEVRCSIGSWHESGQADEDDWLAITDAGEKSIRWN